MNQFFHEIWLRVRYRVWCSVLGYDDVDFDATKLSKTDLDSIATNTQQPYVVSFDITYWNREHTQQWRRGELFVYEPQTPTAFIRHSGAPGLITPGKAASRAPSRALG